MLASLLDGEPQFAVVGDNKRSVDSTAEHVKQAMGGDVRRCDA